MPATSVASIQTHFAHLPDPRSDHTKQHLLLDIIVIAFAAIIWVLPQLARYNKLDLR